MRRDMLFRSLEISSAPENGAVPVTFSSETQDVFRYFYGNLVEGRVREVLLHTPEAVNMSRLSAMGAALLNHDPDRIVGRVVNPRLDGKTARAEIVFDPDESSQEILGKVTSGSLRGVSVGYRINQAEEVPAGQTAYGISGPAYVATRWTPYEISLTPIPADASVGVGRSDDGGIIIRDIHTGDTDMNEEQISTLVTETTARAVEQAVAQAIAAMKPAPDTGHTREQLDALRQRAEALGGEYPGIVLRGIAEGTPAFDIMGQMLAHQARNADAGDRGGVNPGVNPPPCDAETFARSIRTALIR